MQYKVNYKEGALIMSLFKQYNMLTIALMVCLSVVSACGQHEGTAKKNAPVAKEKRPEYFRVEAPESSPFMGNIDAPVTIVTFADFQAPKATANARALKKLVAQFGDSLKVVYRANPQPKHQNAMRAELAARAAARQNKFWEMHDALFERGKLNDADITAAAMAAKCNVKQLRRDMDDPSLKAVIAADRQYALELGLTITPFNFINGRPIKPIAYAADAANIVKEELARAGKLFSNFKETKGLYKKLVAGGKKRLSGPKWSSAQKLTLDPEARYNIPVFDDDLSIGKADAPITIVAFVDPGCPFSAAVTRTLFKLRAQKKETVRLVFKHAPMPSHPGAERASEALVEALRQGKAAKFHDLLLDNFNDLSEAGLLKYAKKAGMDTTALGIALAEGRHRIRVQKDRALATKLKIEDTPYLFSNGKMFRGTRSLDQLIVIVKDELKIVNQLNKLKTVADAGLSLTVYEKMTSNGAVSPVYLKPGSAYVNQAFVNDGKYRVYNLIIPATAPILGNPDAPFTLVEFGDYQCGMCAAIRPKVEELLKKLGKEINFVFLHYPIRGHEHAALAAEAAVEAAVQGKFWQLHNRMMDHQDLLTFDDLLRHAEAVGMNTQKLNASLKSRTHQNAVIAMKKLARTCGLAGTPSFYLNGRKLPNGKMEHFAAKIIDHIKTPKETH